MKEAEEASEIDVEIENSSSTNTEEKIDREVAKLKAELEDENSDKTVESEGLTDVTSTGQYVSCETLGWFRNFG